MPIYAVRRTIATVVALAAISAETLINIGHVRTSALSWAEQPLVIAIAITGVAQAVALMILTDAWKRRRYILASTAFVALASAVALSGTTAYLRTVKARADVAARDAAPYKAAQAKVAAIKTSADAECAKRGPECRALEGKLREAKVDAATVPAPVANALGALDMVPDLALPLMLLFSAFAFIAYAEGQSDFPNPDTLKPSDIDDARKVLREPSNSASDRPNRTKTRTFSGGASDAHPHPRRTVRQSKRSAVMAYVTTETALGRSIPSQMSLAERFDMPKSTVADILADMERSGLIVRRVEGRRKVVL